MKKDRTQKAMYTLRLAFVCPKSFLNGIRKQKKEKKIIFFKTGDPVSLRVFVNLKPNPLKKH